MSTMILIGNREARYRGLRMSADEFLALPDDGYRYELIDGVVCMSPSPSWPHQRIITEVATQIRAHVVHSPVGEVAVEVDVRLSDDLVYRPDLIFLSPEKAALCDERVTVIPDLVVEVASPDSRRYDHETKKNDYEQAGVAEYWIVDPERGEFTFYRLQGGQYVPATASRDAFASEVIPGFTLDVARVRKLFP